MAYSFSNKRVKKFV